MIIQTVFTYLNSGGTYEDKLTELDRDFVYALNPGDTLVLEIPESGKKAIYKFKIDNRRFDNILASPQYAEFRCTQVF